VMESTSFQPMGERHFVGSHLGPMIHENHPDVMILGYDHNKDIIQLWAKTLLDPTGESAKYIDGIAFHWYASHDYFEHLDAVHDSFPDTILLATEVRVHLLPVHLLSSMFHRVRLGVPHVNRLGSCRRRRGKISGTTSTTKTGARENIMDMSSSVI